MKTRDEASDLLTRYRRTHPGSGRAALNWARVRARIDADTAAVPIPPRAGGAVRWWTAGAAFAIAAALLLLLRAVFGATAARHTDAATPSQAIDRGHDREDGGTASQHHAVRPAGTKADATAIATVDATGPTHDAATPMRPSPRTPTRATTEPTAMREAAGTDEVELLTGARDALARGDLDGLDAALGEHARRFPTGVLLEERLAYAVQLACRRGDRDRDALRDRFTARFPGSHHHRAIRESCGTQFDGATP